MDPINPIAGNPEALNLEDPERPEGVEGQPPKDPHGITVASVAIFVLLSLSTVAFLYYQNQKLKSMLAGYQQIQYSPTPFPTPTILETASPSASPKSKKITPNPYSTPTKAPVSSPSAVPKMFY